MSLILVSLHFRFLCCQLNTNMLICVFDVWMKWWMEELVAGWIWRPLYQCVNLSWWYSHMKMRNEEEAGGSAASVTHPVCVCAFLSASLSFSFYFHPTFHPHAWCPLPECQGSVYVHTKRTGKGGLWGHTHPSMQTHPNLSLSFFSFSFWSLSGSIFASQKQLTPRRQSSLTQTAVSE